MRAAIATVLLLLATSAHAKSIALVGDSLCFGGVLYPVSGYLVSPYELGRVVQAILDKATTSWADATVKNWGVSSSTPADWLTSPSASLCTAQRANYGHLEAACAAGDGIKNHIGSGYDAVVIIDDGIVSGLTTSEVVDLYVSLNTALDAVNTDIRLSPPPTGPASGNTALPADPNRTAKLAVRTEMSSRAIITGPTWPDLPMSVDSVHFRDHGYATMASLVVGNLP